jgi:signal transduction histidine kinase
LLAEGALVDTLTRIGQPIFHEDLVEKVENAPLREEERQLLLLSPFYWVPLLSNGHLHGLLCVGPRLGNDWMSVDDTRVLTTLANQAGTATHNVRLMEEVRARREDLAEAHQQLVIARENERQALARELHDDAIQQLIGIGYQVQLAQRRLTGSPTGDIVAAEDMGSVNTNIVEVVRSLRLLVRELRPTGVEHMGLYATVQAFMQSMEALNPAIAWYLNAEEADIHLPEATILGLLRIVQESVRNSLRHANAESITVVLERREDVLLLTIKDNGCGFIVPATPLENHFGLVGMRERAQLLGGSLQVDSKPGQGTTILVDLPILGEIDTNE